MEVEKFYVNFNVTQYEINMIPQEKIDELASSVQVLLEYSCDSLSPCITTKECMGPIQIALTVINKNLDSMLPGYRKKVIDSLIGDLAVERQKCDQIIGF